MTFGRKKTCKIESQVSRDLQTRKKENPAGEKPTSVGKNNPLGPGEEKKWGQIIFQDANKLGMTTEKRPPLGYMAGDWEMMSKTKRGGGNLNKDT